MFKIGMNNEQKKFAASIQKIASTEDGKLFFSMLKKNYVDIPLFHTDPVVMGGQVLRAELVKNLLTYVTTLDLERIEELSVLNDNDIQDDF